jgi:hypothetical protein
MENTVINDIRLSQHFQLTELRLPFFRVLFLILLRPLTLAGPKVFFAGKF